MQVIQLVSQVKEPWTTNYLHICSGQCAIMCNWLLVIFRNCLFSPTRKTLSHDLCSNIDNAIKVIPLQVENQFVVLIFVDQESLCIPVFCEKQHTEGSFLMGRQSFPCLDSSLCRNWSLMNGTFSKVTFLDSRERERTHRNASSAFTLHVHLINAN